ncbi:MAG TPA: hypothetical protein VFN61_04690 [Acidimicrobiales bacterium]|nr:hypothetical protein [Acidimicrobiales bacterium]
MPETNSTADQALSLAGSLGTSSQATEQAVAALAGSANVTELAQAREHLVARIYARSDDFAATAALQLVNKALAEVGWPDPFSWKHRKKP